MNQSTNKAVDYLDSVTGIYPALEDAHAVAKQLIAKGIGEDQIQIAAARTSDIKSDEDSNEVLKNVVVDSAIGTTVGAGIGALGQIAIVAANVSLFVASPIMAPLAMIGWGAMVGGFIGAANGISNQDRYFSDLVQDAVNQGNSVLIANTKTEKETELARAVIGDSMQLHAKAAD
ncbi:hypothetical protein LG201_03200 [Methylobacillus gramineus]|uniref:hypothetical protein n=1 Tax=Methylobacillus gramineus TaxID=755169 RepID=UPI001CFFA549|nr:hypothetical protein [Methylobacillus gramineus]MCB5184205.1 hypothetical protein [Methylobacillus gramineus]